MLPSITFCCLITSSMRAFSMSKSAEPIFLSVWAMRLQHGAGLLDLGAHLLDDLFGLRNLGIEILQLAIRFLPPLRPRNIGAAPGD